MRLIYDEIVYVFNAYVSIMVMPVLNSYVEIMFPVTLLIVALMT